MVDQPEHSFSKHDMERLLRELVPPIAIETAKAVATETAKAVATEVSRTIAGDVARGVAEAMAGEFRKLGMETGSADSIARQHRRNMFVDDAIATKLDFDRRMNTLDELARDFDPDDRSFVREQRRRREQNAKTLRETVIRWLVPAILGALLAGAGFRLFEADRSPAPVRQDQPALPPQTGPRATAARPGEVR